jgi:hypothetical protein
MHSNKGKPKPSDVRRNARSQVAPFSIKGELTASNSRRSDAVLVWNISDEGLCLWATAKVRHGEHVQLSLSRPYAVAVSCVVRWCRAIPDGSGFLLGLEATDGLEDLALLHQTLASQSQAS